MPFPERAVPTYTYKLASGKTIKYRPMYMSEEKSLLIAQEQDDLELLINTLRSVVSACVGQPLDDVPIFELEMLFLKIRCASIGEMCNVIIRCDSCADPKAKTSVQVDLTKAYIKTEEGHSNNIVFHDDVGIVMKYPDADILSLIGDGDIDESTPEGMDTTYRVIAGCIDYVYSGSQMYHASEETPEYLVEYVKSLLPSEFNKIDAFFSTMPRMVVPVTMTCPVCHKEQHHELEGIASFF